MNDPLSDGDLETVIRVYGHHLIINLSIIHILAQRSGSIYNVPEKIASLVMNCARQVVLVLCIFPDTANV